MQVSGGGGGGGGVWDMERLQAEEREHPSSNLVNDGVILPHETREVSYPPCKASTRGCAFFNLFVLFVCLLVCLFACLFVFSLFVHLFSLFVCFLSVCLFVFSLFVCLFVFSRFCLSV